jgi:drug/metabolite transporter (DMT)-like permease
MNATRIAGIVLIVAGIAGFLLGSFSFNQDTTAAKLGPLQLTVKEKKIVDIPRWLSVGAIVIGAVVLVLGSRKP